MFLDSASLGADGVLPAHARWVGWQAGRLEAPFAYTRLDPATCLCWGLGLMVTGEPGERPVAAGGSQPVYAVVSGPLPYRTLQIGKVVWKFPEECKDSWGH